MKSTQCKLPTMRKHKPYQTNIVVHPKSAWNEMNKIRSIFVLLDSPIYFLNNSIIYQTHKTHKVIVLIIPQLAKHESH